MEWFEHRIDDGPIEIAVSILVPYAAYLTAEAIHASGVLAVVAAGLYLGRKSSEFFSPGVRLQSQAVWDSLTFILNGFVFVLIGLQLPSVLAGVRELSPGTTLLLRRPVQRVSDSASPLLDVSRRLCRLLHSHAAAAPERKAAGPSSNFRGRLDGNAGRSRTRSRHVSAADHRRRQPFSPSGSDRVPDVLRHSGDARIPRADASGP